MRSESGLITSDHIQTAFLYPFSKDFLTLQPSSKTNFHMKKFSLPIILFAIVALTALRVQAFDHPYEKVCQTFLLKTEVASFSFDEENPSKSDPTKDFGVFSAEISRVGGVKIAGCPDEIEHYEIRSADGALILFSTDDEKEFTKQLFSMRGAYQVRFHTADWFYSGPASL